MQVAVIQSSLPTLQELHVAGNSISSLHVQLEQHSQQEQQQPPQQRDWPPLEGFKSLQVASSLPPAVTCSQATWLHCASVTSPPAAGRLVVLTPAAASLGPSFALAPWLHAL
jgi:hypothetical protein